MQLTSEESEELLNLAAQQVDNAACLHEFTSLINQSFSKKKKTLIVEMLWRAALADRELNKYEEHLVRKVADLLHVSHKDFIRAKHRVYTDLAGI